MNRIGDAVSAFRLLVAGPATIREIVSLRGHTREITGAVFSPDGQYVVTSSKDGAVALWPAFNISAVISVASDDLTISREQQRIFANAHD